MVQKKEQENKIIVKCLKSFNNYGYTFIKFKEYEYKNPTNNFVEFLKKMADKKFLEIK